MSVGGEGSRTPRRSRRGRSRASSRPEASGPPPARAQGPWTWAGLVIVAAVAAAVYANSLGGALMYDDVNAIVRNRVVVDESFGTIFTTPSWWRAGHGRGWRPVTTVTFALNHVVHELAPWGYHAVNVLLHAAVSALVVTTFATVTGAGGTALIAGLLFAAHPVHTEAVASVVGRSELLAALAFFGAWTCFLCGARGRRLLWDSAGVLVFLAGLMAKENVITLLPVLVLVDLLFPREASGPLATVRRHLPRYAGLVVAVAVYVGLRQVIIGPGAPGPQPLDNPLVDLSLGPRLLTAVAVVGRYAWRLVLPYQLAADYSFDQIPALHSPLEAGFLVGLGVLLVIPAFAWRTRTSAPSVALGLGFLALTFSLVANLVFPIGTIMAERLVYLPSAGFCLLAGVVLMRLAGGTADGERGADPRTFPPLVIGVVLLVVGLYAVRTVDRNQVWRDPETFFATMVREAPRSARSHREYAGVLSRLGRHDEAVQGFERSLAIMPDDPATFHNLGNALVAAGDLDAAAQAYGRAVAAKPDFIDALMNLATVQDQLGRSAAAIATLQQALQYAPGRPGVHMNLANSYFRAGRLPEARAEYEAALAGDPRSVGIRLNYGIFLSSQRDYTRAAAVYEPVSTMNPQAAAGLVIAYAGLRDGQRARAALAAADARFPGSPAVPEQVRRAVAAMP